MPTQSEQLWDIKIAYVFIITLVPYIALIPALSDRCKDNVKTLGVMNAFAGGVFLSMALIHILPESAETYKGIIEDQMNTDQGLPAGTSQRIFPLPYLVFFLGYAIILLIDRVVSSHFGDGHGHGHSHGGQAEHSHKHSEH